MRRNYIFAGALCVVSLTGCVVGGGEPAPGARADFKSADGADNGSAVLFQRTEGVLIRASVKGLTQGEHGYHIHSVGKCEPPFESSGGHFNPGGHKHGRLSQEGAHLGDLPNLSVGLNGEAHSETIVRGLTLESLFDADGSSLIVHAHKDDYVTDPSGNSGARVICGVIRRATQPPVKAR